MSDPTRWSTSADIAASVRRRWTDGSLLRSAVTGEAFVPIDLPLRGPKPDDLGIHFDAAREWAADIVRDSRSGRAYTVVMGRMGGRAAGTTEVPVRIVIDTEKQAWHLLRVADDVERFREMVRLADRQPAVREWALTRPLRALAVSSEWSGVLAAAKWLERNRGSGRYVREIDSADVDTKFIERHRRDLAEIVGASSASALVTALGLASRPATVRLRFGRGVLDLPAGLTEATLRTSELSELPSKPSSALIVENEITYLSVPVPEDGVVLWGKGYDADQAASLTWLGDANVRYWGDLDTHGFAILNRVRSRLPHARSVLMDRATLLEFETRWGSEASPTRARLEHLTIDEQRLYEDLVSDAYRSRVRLEQERIDWGWVLENLRR